MSKVKEIWIYHHSHLDIGYTHPQPILWELQRQYMDQALKLCARTEHEPDELKFRWTCEATASVLYWLESAAEDDIASFEHFINNGQICLTATNMHGTPLSNAEQLARMLYPAQQLRDRFGAKLNTAINHDVNGQPWTYAQIMLDAGIELYTTGINIHFGGIPLRRPLAFRWQAPDGRELLTFNGEHYSIFTQFCELWDKDLAKMKRGISTYLARLEQEDYPYDFVYISSTNFPLLDNTPPDEELLEMVQRWNAAELGPKLKLVTPEMLLARLKELPDDELPLYAGDWTDYWNFGAASSAEETRLTRRTKQSLQTAEWLAAFQGVHDARDRELYKEAWHQLNLYDEHTWGANESIMHPDSIFTKTLWMHKAHSAYQANSLSGYLLARQLEHLADNPLQSEAPEGLLLVNSAAIAQKVDVRVSEEFTYKGRHVSANRYKFQQNNADIDWKQPVLGTVELPPFSWMKMPYDELQKSVKPAVDVSDNSIETPYYRLQFDPATGRIHRLYDKRRHWELLDPASEWTLFQFLQERIDEERMPAHRTTLFPRDIEQCNNSISCWNHDWPALRTGATKLLHCRVDQHDAGATLELVWEAPGVEKLEQRITLFADHPSIECSATFFKLDIRTPESLYFTFPLNLNNWKATYDTAGAFVELDQEQLPGASKDWVTVDQAVSVYDEHHGVTLVCPDAPLVQIGDFNFGKEQSLIPREGSPLLLAWPVTNYWDTNFRASQPGLLTMKYSLIPFTQFDEAEVLAVSAEVNQPVQLFPAVHCSKLETGTFMALNNPHIAVVGVKPAESGSGIVLRLMNVSREPQQVELKLPSQAIQAASLTNMVEREPQPIEIVGEAAAWIMPPRKLMTIHVQL